MESMSEKTQLLRQYGEALLQRLHKAVFTLTDPNLRPAFVSDPTHIKVLNGLLKKHPNLQVPDSSYNSVQGVDSILADAQKAEGLLDDVYFTMVDTVTFISTGWKMVAEAFSAYPDLNLERNGLLTETILDVVALIIRCSFLMNHLPEKRIVAVVYSRVYALSNGAPEQNLFALAKFLTDYGDNALKHLHKEVDERTSTGLGRTLLSLQGSYLTNISVEQLRSNGSLNFTVNAEKMCFPTVIHGQLNLKLSYKIFMWISYGLLAVPKEFESQEALDLLRLALQQSFLTPCYLNLTSQVAPEYDNILGIYKCADKNAMKQVKKAKKMVMEFTANAISAQTGPKYRQDRRDFVRQELQQMNHLIQDYPGLMGPKMDVIWSALSIAKEEIMLYFTQLHTPPPVKLQKQYQGIAKQYRDPRISQLLSCVEDLVQLIRSYTNVIQEYYLDYLHGADLVKMTEFYEQAQSKGISGWGLDAMYAIVAELEAVSVDAFREGHEYYFEDLRSNCLKLESFLSQASCPLGHLAQNTELTRRLKLIYLHSLNVDSIEGQIYDYAALEGLFFMSEQLYEEFESSFNGQMASNTGSFINLIFKVPYSVTPYTADLAPRIGTDCSELTHKMLQRITDRIQGCLDVILNHYIKFDSQLTHANAASSIARPAAGGKQAASPHPPQIATESHSKQRAQLQELREAQMVLMRLCTCLRNMQQIAVHDKEFNSLVFVREMVSTTTRDFLLKTLTVQGPQANQTTVQRPSQLMRLLQTFAYVMRIIENYLPIDVEATINEVVFNLVHNPVLDAENPIEWSSQDVTVDMKSSSPLLIPFMEWMNDFITKQLEFNAAIYSPPRMSFISTGVNKYDDFININEMMALASLVGSSGIQLIDRVILRVISLQFSAIKDILVASKDDLADFDLAYGTDECIPSARMIAATRDLDGFMNKSATIGKCLIVRRMLYRGLNMSMKGKLPAVESVVRSLFDSFHHSGFEEPLVQAASCLALTAGIDVGIEDAALRNIFRSAAEEAGEVWAHTPCMLAAGIFSSLWTTTSYKPALDAFMNNAHLLSEAALVLLTIPYCISGAAESQEISSVQYQVKKFVEISSVILTRLLRIPARDLQKKISIQSLNSIIIFLDVFIKNQTFISRSTLDSLLPYHVMKSVAQDLIAIEKEHQSKQKKGVLPSDV